MSGLVLAVVLAVAGSPAHQYHYRFNAWNRLVKVRLPGGLYVDGDGELQGTPGGRVLRFEYDALGSTGALTKAGGEIRRSPEPSSDTQPSG